MATTELRVGRILAAIELLGTDLTPEELIIRAWSEGSERNELVGQLSAITYTYGEYPAYPSEGKTTGTWDQVRQAKMMGFLSEAELCQSGIACDRHPLTAAPSAITQWAVPTT
jgi:hypothetical protein